MAREREALLAAVLAAPDDDAPRLAWADAVGGGLGALVRAQCALARTGRGDAARAALEAEEGRLFAEHGGEVAWPGVGERGVGVVRGFVEHIVVDARSFVARGAALQRTVVRSVRLEGVRGVLDEVLACPWLARIEALDVGGAFLTNLDAEKIAAAATLARLRSLDVSRNDLDDVGVAHLADSAVFALSRLVVSGNIVGEEGLAAIARGRACVGLRELGVAREVVSSAGFGIVVRARSIRELARLPLRRLGLRGHEIDEELAWALRDLEQLEEVDLRDCRLSPSAERALARFAPAVS